MILFKHSIRDIRVRALLLSDNRSLKHSYRWQDWVLDQKAGIEHIKYAYEQGINAFE